MRPFLLFLPLLLSSSAQACINDRDSDSLAVQAKKLPDTLRVITGRFERNPPLYYEMRIERSLAQLKRNPRDFGLYDDIGAAFDRLHRDDEALEIMAKKRAILPRFDAKNSMAKEAWYRYYANAGTFRAHRFLGDKTQPMSEMKTARDFIARAIEIKPNAHFGREKIQLMTMDWILATKTGKMKDGLDSLDSFLDDHEKWFDDDTSATIKQREEATKGLSGLIVLGAAWQSVDVFEALAASLQSKEGITLSYLAWRRAQELLQQGHHSMARDGINSTNIDVTLRYFFTNDEAAGVNAPNAKTLDALYVQLRAEAETWNSRRQNYMMARLERGDHPDWDKQFWAEWKPAAPPSLDVDWVNEKQNKEDQRQKAFGVEKIIKIAVVLLAGAVALAWMLKVMAQERKYRSNFL